MKEQEIAEMCSLGSNGEIYQQLMLNAISDLVALFLVEEDDRFRVLKANRSFLSTLELAEAQAIGNTLEEISPRLWTILNHNCVRAIREGKEITYEETSEFGCFEHKLIPLHNDQGHCSQLVFTARDISEKRKLEEHFLTSEKLESIGILAGGIAHDFNNILTVITGNISLLRTRFNQLNGRFEERDRIFNLLSEIEKASFQATDLTQQMLTFAKGGDPLLRITPLEDLLRVATAFALRGSNVGCEFALPAGLWPAEIDEGQINQVVQNLIINAAQAMPDGGIVTISAENVALTTEHALPLKYGEYVKISIADHGRGIAKEYLDKIFDPFFTTKEAGSGLGLATAYSIIKKHSGYIAVESEVGRGSTFQIYLPANPKGEQVEQPRSSSDARSKGRILVMDDEKVLRMMLKEMLAYLGYDAVCVKDGFEAIETYRKASLAGRKFDAMIMDLTVPGSMGGKEAIKRLLEIDPDVRAIVSSGYSTDPVMSNYQKFGFKAVVAKPYSMEELAETLEQIIGDDLPTDFVQLSLA
ncbi:MAG TPA: ATP-binding protein [Desulfobacteria bacterium]|nr:ATP-binding protein [Desulfobacteria bacterium]